MVNDRNRHYFFWGLTAAAVVAFGLLLCFTLLRYSEVSSGLSKIADILMPVIYGLVMAFLMAPLYNIVVDGLAGKPDRNGKTKGSLKLAHFLATVACIIAILASVTAVIAMLVPSVIKAVRDLVSNMPQGYTSVGQFIESWFHEDPETGAFVLSVYNQLYERFSDWVSNDLLQNLQTYLTSLTTGVMRVVGVFKNFIIGLIIMAYVLNMKDLLKAQCKRIIYSLFPVGAGNDIVNECRYVQDVFSKFIVGKIIDSVIIGVLCYICLRFMKIPYAILISCIVGITNIIPFFGPFIGAVPSAFILLITDPVAAVQFLVFILVLQQFDGNILGPKILGQTTGVSSFWILFSILFFGGLWGIVGMVIGIPTFAVIARQVNRFVEHRLRKKKLTTETDEYRELLEIDRKTGTFIRKDQAAEQEDLQSGTK